jgi:hypothetical protein
MTLKVGDLVRVKGHGDATSRIDLFVRERGGRAVRLVDRIGGHRYGDVEDRELVERASDTVDETARAVLKRSDAA